MPNPAPVSREYRIYLALWRKAYISGEFAVKASSFQMALSMRQGMYRAIKPYRVGHATDDTLLKAAEKFVLFLDRKKGQEDQPHEIVFRERKALSELERSFAELGIDEDDLLIGDEREANASLQRLIEVQEHPEPRSTPYFKRD